MSTITVPIPDELRQEMEKLSQQQGRALTELVVESMRRYIAAQELREIRAELRPYAEAEGFFSDEDIFKAVS